MGLPGRRLLAHLEAQLHRLRLLGPEPLRHARDRRGRRLERLHVQGGRHDRRQVRQLLRVRRLALRHLPGGQRQGLGGPLDRVRALRDGPQRPGPDHESRRHDHEGRRLQRLQRGTSGAADRPWSLGGDLEPLDVRLLHAGDRLQLDRHRRKHPGGRALVRVVPDEELRRRRRGGRQEDRAQEVQERQPDGVRELLRTSARASDWSSGSEREPHPGVRRSPPRLRPLAGPAAAWVYPEHRNIAGSAIEGLDPARKATLERLWAEARKGHEDRLCESPWAGDQGKKPGCIDFAAFPALAGDHSCSADEMLKTVLETKWVMDVAEVAAVLDQGLATAKNKHEAQQPPHVVEPRARAQGPRIQLPRGLEQRPLPPDARDGRRDGVPQGEHARRTPT